MSLKFKKIILLLKIGTDVTRVEYINSSMLITNNHIIILEDHDTESIGNIYKINEIKSYKTYNK
jgi:hypothetical protein